MNRTRTLFASSHLGCLLLVGFTLSGCGGDKKGAESGADVATGSFGADMRVSLVNDGPMTIIMDVD